MEFIKEFINQTLSYGVWFFPKNKNRHFNYGHFELCNQAFELSLLERKIEEKYNEKGDLKSRNFYFKLK